MRLLLTFGHWLQALLDDHVVKTQAMRASPFIKALEADVLAWERLLLAAQASGAAASTPCCRLHAVCLHARRNARASTQATAQMRMHGTQMSATAHIMLCRTC